MIERDWIPTDCKSLSFGIRWFESSRPHLSMKMTLNSFGKSNSRISFVRPGFFVFLNIYLPQTSVRTLVKNGAKC
jgi:hypothetical protein